MFKEGIPAFYENDPVEFLTGTDWNPFYQSGSMETQLIHVNNNPYDFSIILPNNKLYIYPNSTYNEKILIKNIGGNLDTYEITINDLTDNIFITPETNNTSIQPHQEETISLSIRANTIGTFPVSLTVQSVESNIEKTIDLSILSSTLGINIYADDKTYTTSDPSASDRIPIQFEHIGIDNETFSVSISSPSELRPSIANTDWNYTTSSTTITLQGLSKTNFSIIPRQINKISGSYAISVEVRSLYDEQVSSSINITYIYDERTSISIDQRNKSLSSNNEAMFTINLTSPLAKTGYLEIDGTSNNWQITLIEQDQTLLTDYGGITIDFKNSKQRSINLYLTANHLNFQSSEFTISFGNPGTKPTFQILPFIYGTIITTLIAILIAAPLGIACSIFLAEYVPVNIRKILRPIYDLLAGIPSVIYGLWGFMTFAPFANNHIYPVFANTVGRVIPFFEETSQMGRGIFTASIVLSIMIIPIIISLSEDAIRSVKGSLKQGSLALGTTRWQTLRNVILPEAKSGIISSIILGTGRAIGETMAVLMIMGLVTKIPDTIYDPVTTMTGIIALLFEFSFDYDLTRHAIFAVGSVLFIMVFSLNILIYLLQSKKTKRNHISIGNIFKKRENKENDSPIQKEKFLIIDEEIHEKKFIFIDHQKPISTKRVTDKGIIDKSKILKSTKNAIIHEKIVLIFLFVSSLIGLVFLLDIIGMVFVNGASTFQIDLLLKAEEGMHGGGFLNAILGSLSLIAIALLIAAPLSISTAIYVVEYAKKDNILTKIILFTSDTLASTPSIVFGAFGFMFFVLFLKFGYSLLAGGFTLGFMIIPLLLRSSIEAIKSIPQSFKEGAYALGSTKWKAIVTVILPPASSGIISGVIISIGRAIGETAAVLLTARYAQSLPSNLFNPVGSMPILIYEYFGQSIKFPVLAQKVYSAAMVLILIVLLLNLVSRYIGYRSSKMMKY